MPLMLLRLDAKLKPRTPLSLRRTTDSLLDAQVFVILHSQLGLTWASEQGQFDARVVRSGKI
jgi:hypothetical protein